MSNTIEKKDAIISDCKQFRYSLCRVWDASKPKVLFIMLNPSTADAETDDATIRRCRGYAESWGYGGFFVGNLFPFRSPEPKDLLKCENPIGENNEEYLKTMAEHCCIIVCAWGNSPIVNKIKKRFPDYLPLKKIVGELHYLELSNDGTPKHPLYLPKTLTPVRYAWKETAYNFPDWNYNYDKEFDAFKRKVANESKHYPSLKKNNGEFNEQFLKAAFDAGQSARECCNSMTEVV